MNFLNEISIPIIGLVFLLVVVFSVNSCNHSEFKEVCDKSGGVTVWDGRQYQCINTIPATIKSK